jgi:hypothetical protein
MNNDHATNQTRNHDGSCHCGAVRFRAQLDLGRGATRCNCSICTKLGLTALLVKPPAFTLLAGAGGLGAYQWGGKIATRYFCKVCGVFVYAQGHLAEVGGDFVSINLNCVDDVDVDQLPIAYWDGRHDNWEAGPSPAPWPRFRAAPEPRPAASLAGLDA